MMLYYWIQCNYYSKKLMHGKIHFKCHHFIGSPSYNLITTQLNMHDRDSKL